MAVKVVIEGSRITRSTRLAAGERRAAILTPDLQKLIDGGFVIVIERTVLSDETVDVAVDEAPEEAPADDAPVNDTDPEPAGDPEPVKPPRSSRAKKPTTEPEVVSGE